MTDDLNREELQEEVYVPNEERDPEEEALWYVIHTYSGYENKVKATLEQIVENRDIHDYIQEITIPMEEQLEIKDGKRKTVLRKKYPGYVLVKMLLTDEIWYMGMVNEWVPVVDYGVGDSVKVINGPLESFVGVVDGISSEKKKVRVLVNMFGRETPVELDFTQVIRFVQ